MKMMIAVDRLNQIRKLRLLLLNLTNKDHQPRVWLKSLKIQEQKKTIKNQIIRRLIKSIQKKKMNHKSSIKKLARNQKKVKKNYLRALPKEIKNQKLMKTKINQFNLKQTTTQSKLISVQNYTTKECSPTVAHPTKKLWLKYSRSNLAKNE